jgi:AraC-like DNA-binding protein
VTITLSHRAYWDLFAETVEQNAPDPQDITWRYPHQLGDGTWREIELRDGLDLAIAHYQVHQPISIHLPERPHPIEYTFRLSGQGAGASYDLNSGQYCLYGSGIAPTETTEFAPSESVVEVNVHIDPDLFLSLWGRSGASEMEVAHLFTPDSQPYYTRVGQITTAMQIAVQQIVQCPFAGITQRLYLESKVWELMGLLLAQEMDQTRERAIAPRLKPDDIDRIHQAKEILLQRLDNPPSLLELARQVGLNDCTLKRGFREVFGKTAFGYLHDYRLEKARHLLGERRLNVSETARKVGFANRSYFAAAFKKKFGMNPKDYANYRNSA